MNSALKPYRRHAKAFTLIFLGSLSPLLHAGITQATPPNSVTRTLPSITLSYLFNAQLADALLLEANSQQYRINNTLALALGTRQRTFVKLGGEYLTQARRFQFKNGPVDERVGQWAVGVDALHMMNPQWGLSGHADYSHAPSHNLSNVVFDNNEGQIDLARHLAGADAYSLEAGGLWQPTPNLQMQLHTGLSAIAYDTVFLNKKAMKSRQWSERSSLKAWLSAAWQWRISNRYEAGDHSIASSIAFTQYRPASDWQWSLSYQHVMGQKGLGDMNQLLLGLQLNFHANGLNRNQGAPHAPSHALDLAQWVHTPAVYRPTVYVIAEQSNHLCVPPHFVGEQGSGSILDVVLHPNQTVNIDKSAAFTGTALHFSYQLQNGPYPGISYNADGSMVGAAPSVGNQHNSMSITALNACGSATSNSFDMQITATV